MGRAQRVLKILTCITTIAFLATTVAWSMPEIWPSDMTINPDASTIQSFGNLKIPAEIGWIESIYQSRGNAPFVVLIPDAHAVKDAQDRIEELICFLEKELGIRTVALEGGAGELDDTILRAFPDGKIKRRVLEKYLEKAEITGPVMASIFGPAEACFHGVEDWKLYEKEYEAYFDSVRTRDSVLKEIEAKRAQYESDLGRVYSGVHREFHDICSALKSGKIDLVAFFAKLDSLDAGALTPETERYPEMSKLRESFRNEESIDRVRVSTSLRSYADEIGRETKMFLSPERRKEFNQKYQEWNTGALADAGFLRFLTDLEDDGPGRGPLPLPLEKLERQSNLLLSLMGTRIFDEIERFIDLTEERLSERPEEMRLSRKIRRLETLERLTKLEMTREQYDAYRNDRDGLEFDLDGEERFEPFSRFYEIALSREQAFEMNLEALLSRDSRRSAVFVLGGFHVKGVGERLRAKGCSYAVVVPKFGSLRGGEKYGGVLEGRVSYRDDAKGDFYDAFMRHAAGSLAYGASGPGKGRVLKAWRDDVVRKLARAGRIGEAGRYTKYIDRAASLRGLEAQGTEGERPGAESVLDIVQREFDLFAEGRLRRARKLWEEILRRFLQGLNDLRKKDQLTKLNIHDLVMKERETKPALFALPLDMMIPGLGRSARILSAQGAFRMPAKDSVEIGGSGEFSGVSGEGVASSLGAIDWGSLNGNILMDEKGGKYHLRIREGFDRGQILMAVDRLEPEFQLKQDWKFPGYAEQVSKAGVTVAYALLREEDGRIVIIATETLRGLRRRGIYKTMMKTLMDLLPEGHEVVLKDVVERGTRSALLEVLAGNLPEDVFWGTRIGRGFSPGLFEIDGIKEMPGTEDPGISVLRVTLRRADHGREDVLEGTMKGALPSADEEPVPIHPYVLRDLEVLGDDPVLGRVVKVNGILGRLRAGGKKKDGMSRENFLEHIARVESRAFSKPGDAGNRNNLEFMMDTWDIRLKDRTYDRCLLLDTDNRVRGYLYASNEAGPYGYIFEMATDPRGTVRGRGTLLLDSYVEELRKRGKKILTWVSADPAFGFYCRYLAERMDYESDGAGNFTAYLDTRGKLTRGERGRQLKYADDFDAHVIKAKKVFADLSPGRYRLIRTTNPPDEEYFDVTPDGIMQEEGPEASRKDVRDTLLWRLIYGGRILERAGTGEILLTPFSFEKSRVTAAASLGTQSPARDVLSGNEDSRVRFRKETLRRLPAIREDPRLGRVIDLKNLMIFLNTDRMADLAREIERLESEAFDRESAVDLGMERAVTNWWKSYRYGEGGVRREIYLLFDTEGVLRGLAVGETNETAKRSTLMKLATDPSDGIRGRGTLLMDAFMDSVAAREIESVNWVSTPGAVMFYTGYLTERMDYERFWCGFAAYPATRGTLTAEELAAQSRHCRILRESFDTARAFLAALPTGDYELEKYNSLRTTFFCIDEKGRWSGEESKNGRGARRLKEEVLRDMAMQETALYRIGRDSEDAVFSSEEGLRVKGPVTSSGRKIARGLSLGNELPEKIPDFENIRERLTMLGSRGKGAAEEKVYDGKQIFLLLKDRESLRNYGLAIAASERIAYGTVVKSAEEAAFDWLDALMKDEDEILVLADHNGRIRGVLRAWDKGARESRLHSIGTDRRDGVGGRGTTLMDVYFGRLIARGITIAKWRSLENAIGFYLHYLAERALYEMEQNGWFTVNVDSFGKLSPGQIEKQKQYERKSAERRRGRGKAGGFPGKKNGSSGKVRGSFLGYETPDVKAEQPWDTIVSLPAHILGELSSVALSEDHTLGKVIDLNSLIPRLDQKERRDLALQITRLQVQAFPRIAEGGWSPDLYWRNLFTDWENRKFLDCDRFMVFDGEGIARGYLVGQIYPFGGATVHELASDSTDGVKGRGSLLMDIYMNRLRTLVDVDGRPIKYVVSSVERSARFFHNHYLATRMDYRFSSYHYLTTYLDTYGELTEEEIERQKKYASDFDANARSVREFLSALGPGEYCMTLLGKPVLIRKSFTVGEDGEWKAPYPYQNLGSGKLRARIEEEMIFENWSLARGGGEELLRSRPELLCKEPLRLRGLPWKEGASLGIAPEADIRVPLPGSIVRTLPALAEHAELGKVIDLEDIYPHLDERQKRDLAGQLEWIRSRAFKTEFDKEKLDRTVESWLSVHEGRRDEYFILIDHQGLVRGYVAGSVDLEKSFCASSEIAVDPDDGVKGRGTLLMDAFLKHLRKNEVKCLEIDANPEEFPFFVKYLRGRVDYERDLRAFAVYPDTFGQLTARQRSEQELSEESSLLDRYREISGKLGFLETGEYGFTTVAWGNYELRFRVRDDGKWSGKGFDAQTFEERMALLLDPMLFYRSELRKVESGEVVLGSDGSLREKMSVTGRHRKVIRAASMGGNDDGAEEWHGSVKLLAEEIRKCLAPVREQLDLFDSLLSQAPPHDLFVNEGVEQLRLKLKEVTGKANPLQSFETKEEAAGYFGELKGSILELAGETGDLMQIVKVLGEIYQIRGSSTYLPGIANGVMAGVPRLERAVLVLDEFAKAIREGAEFVILPDRANEQPEEGGSLGASVDWDLIEGQSIRDKIGRKYRLRVEKDVKGGVYVLADGAAPVPGRLEENWKLVASHAGREIRENTVALCKFHAEGMRLLFDCTETVQVEDYLKKGIYEAVMRRVADILPEGCEFEFRNIVHEDTVSVILGIGNGKNAPEEFWDTVIGKGLSREQFEIRDVIPLDVVLVKKKAEGNVPAVREMLADWKVRPDPLTVADLIREKGLSAEDILAAGEELGYARPVMEKSLKELESLVPYLFRMVDAIRAEFPEREALFLGRDAELLYDVYQILSMDKGERSDASLFPGSRMFWLDGNNWTQGEESAVIQKYFESNGISRKVIDGGRKYLLVDSGFHGSVAAVVRSKVQDLYGIPDEVMKSIMPIRLVSTMGGDFNGARNLMSFEATEEDIKGLEHNFPKASRAAKHPVLRPNTALGSDGFLEYGIDVLLAISMQVFPHFHDVYETLGKRDGRLIPMPLSRGDVAADVDDVSDGFNASIVNPVAALLVQRELIEKTMDAIARSREKQTVNELMEDAIPMLDHEIRTPLTMLKGSVLSLLPEFLESEIDEGSKAELRRFLETTGMQARIEEVLVLASGLKESAEDGVDAGDFLPLRSGLEYLNALAEKFHALIEDVRNRNLSDYVDGISDSLEQGIAGVRVACNGLHSIEKILGKGSFTGAPEPGGTEIAVTIRNITNYLGGRLRGGCKVELLEEGIKAKVDRDHIERVWDNMIRNAIEAGARRAVFEVAWDGDFVKTRIIDDGKGIKEKKGKGLDWIFEKGRSGKGSTGLGLWICKEIVEAAGGTITVESEVGKGTEFTVKLPRAAAVKPAEPSSPLRILSHKESDEALGNLLQQTLINSYAAYYCAKKLILSGSRNEELEGIVSRQLGRMKGVIEMILEFRSPTAVKGPRGWILWSDAISEQIGDFGSRAWIANDYFDESDFAISVRELLSVMKGLMSSEDRLSEECLKSLAGILGEVSHVYGTDDENVVKTAIRGIKDFVRDFSGEKAFASSLGRAGDGAGLLNYFPAILIGDGVGEDRSEEFAAHVEDVIRNGGGVEALEVALNESFGQMLGRFLEQIRKGRDVILSEVRSAHDMTQFVQSDGFEKLSREKLRGVAKERDVLEFLTAVRAAVFSATVGKSGTGSNRLINVGMLSTEKVRSFWEKAGSAMAVIRDENGGKGVSLATDLPDGEEAFAVYLGVFKRFRHWIDRLQFIVREKEPAQFLNRNSLNGFNWGIQVVRRERESECVRQIEKKSHGRELCILVAHDGVLPVDLLKQLNSVRADFEEIPDPGLQEMALAAALLLLFKLAPLKPAERKELLTKGGSFQGFLEGSGLSFLGGKFGLENGVLRLLTEQFVRSFEAGRILESAA